MENSIWAVDGQGIKVYTIYTIALMGVREIYIVCIGVLKSDLMLSRDIDIHQPFRCRRV